MSHLIPVRLLRLNSMFSRVPLVGVDYSLTTEVARAEAPKIAPPTSLHVSTSISAMQIQSGPETSLAVGDHVTLTTAVANYSSLAQYVKALLASPCSANVPGFSCELIFVLGLSFRLTDSGCFRFGHVFGRPEFTHYWWHFRESLLRAV